MSNNITIREKCKKNGFSSLTDAEKIRLLLSYSENSSDADRLTEKLVDFYGSLRAISDADPIMLKKEYGLNDSSVVMLGLVPAVSRNCAINSCRSIKLNSSENARKYFSAFLRSSHSEVTAMAAVNSRFRITSSAVISCGDVSNVAFSSRKALEFAYNSGEKCLFLAHCHPNGTCRPSENDISATMRIIEALDILDVKLADHIIIAGESSISMREHFGERVFGKPVLGYSVSTTDES